MTFNELCPKTGLGVKNSNMQDDCFAKPVIKLFLATNNVKFTDIDAAKLQTSWDAYKQSKDLIPLYQTELPEAFNTEDTFDEGRNLRTQITKGQTGWSLKMKISEFKYAALKSYSGANYRVFMVNEDGVIMGNYNDAGEIVGIEVEDISVGPFTSTASEVSFATLTFRLPKTTTYFDNVVAIRPSFAAANYEGVYDVNVRQVSATSTEIVVTAKNILGSNVSSLEQADWVFTGGAITGSSYDSATGQYTLTGTGLTAGTLSSAVVTKPDAMYEVLPIEITI